MAIGLQITAADLNNAIGNAGRDFFVLYTRAKSLNQRLKLYSDADLTGMGFAAADLAAIHNFETFVDTLTAVFDGTAPLPAAHNFLADVSSIIGVGL